MINIAWVFNCVCWFRAVNIRANTWFSTCLSGKFAQFCPTLSWRVCQGESGRETLPCLECLSLLYSKTSQKCLYGINFLLEERIIMIFFTKSWFVNFISSSYTFETILTTSNVSITFVSLYSFRVLLIINLIKEYSSWYFLVIRSSRTEN